ARKGRLLSYLAKGDDVATEAELNSVLQIFDNYRANLKRESQRNTFFNVEQSVYDLATDFAWSRKRDPELALKYCELSRGRSLLDAKQKNLGAEQIDDNLERRLSATGEPLSVSEMKEQNPDDAQIVQYAVLDDKLLIWVVNQKQVASREVPVSSRELGERVRRFVRAVGTLPNDSPQTFKADAKELYKLLIAPIESLLDQRKLTCIVPDKVLHYLPFAALMSEAGDEYLIKKFRIQLAPSTTIFLQSLKEGGQKLEPGEERLLSVGNPTFRPVDFPRLQPLPAARDEARTIAKFYNPPYGLLLERNATEQAVRSGLEKSNVAHFALHYVVDERHSLYSKMVLTPPARITNDADDGLLQIHEIYKMDLAHMRLVVLSACQTAIEQQYSGEGAVSVARPFIASGVPLVVATLWPVDSSSSERLMTSFHRERTRSKVSTAEALQRAQLEMLSDTYEPLHHPYYWAAFTVTGRYAKF
ncbi:MAG TPA: CHAT domain-containing protein, partial [Pyrinomonadaceae bacterium]|nr:CHAT domain-containing protein [Pyrinomonadaceae bacterium]